MNPKSNADLIAELEKALGAENPLFLQAKERLTFPLFTFFREEIPFRLREVHGIDPDTLPEGVIDAVVQHFIDTSGTDEDTVICYDEFDDDLLAQLAEHGVSISGEEEDENE